MQLRALFVSSVLVCGQVTATVVPSEAVFNSSFEPGITLQGTVGYPGPLANATVELHLGSYVATTTTKVDGTYKLLVEQWHLSPVTIAELIAFGHGADVSKVWASPLGPSDRLATLGSSGAVMFADEPFLNLNPRSTALAAALRAYNGFAPIGDKATFYKAARSYQGYTNDLTYALALVARGDQALPPGAASTFAAVESLAFSQRLFADERILANVDCGTSPTAPYCVVMANLPTDPAIVPAFPWDDGRLYLFNIYGFASSLYQTVALRPHATTADVFPFAFPYQTANSAVQPDGSYTLTLPGGVPFRTQDTYPTIPPYGQVHQYEELIAIHIRSVRGPGGQSEIHAAGVHRYTYPETPAITQPVIVTDTFDLPRYADNDPLPSELVADVPTIANHRFLLASPFAAPVLSGFDAPYGYDAYTFGASTGSTERQAKTYTFAVTSPTSFSINFSADSTSAEVQFVNEESPGIWRVSMHATGPSSETFFDGLLMETVGAAGGFTAANLPGSYQANVNSQNCGGPYGTLDALTGDPNGCGLPPYFGWIFDVSANVNRRANNAFWGKWQLPGGPDSGRLLFANPSFASPIQQMRGWELMRSNGGNDQWVLENVTVSPDGVASAPPINFAPAARLVHVTY
ncbi:MAG: hypothetical protein ABI082_15995 [Dokdonella sp.]